MWRTFHPMSQFLGGRENVLKRILFIYLNQRARFYFIYVPPTNRFAVCIHPHLELVCVPRRRAPRRRQFRKALTFIIIIIILCAYVSIPSVAFAHPRAPQQQGRFATGFWFCAPGNNLRIVFQDAQTRANANLN